jgi:antitoxin YefM
LAIAKRSASWCALRFTEQSCTIKLYNFLGVEMLIRETTYSQARANLASILDQVHDQSQIVVIKRRNQKNIALIAEDELSSLLESLYLLRSPANAEHLFKAMAWAAESQGEPQTLGELKEELGLESKEKTA